MPVRQSMFGQEVATLSSRLRGLEKVADLTFAERYVQPPRIVKDDVSTLFDSVLKYRPDQSRDDLGRFEDEGKGTGTGAAGGTAIVPISSTRPKDGGTKPPKVPKPKAPVTQTESGWSRAAGIAINAATIAGLASLALPYAGPAIRSATRAGRSLFGRATGAVGSRAPLSTAMRARENARLGGMYQALDVNRNAIVRAKIEIGAAEKAAAAAQARWSAGRLTAGTREGNSLAREVTRRERELASARAKLQAFTTQDRKLSTDIDGLEQLLGAKKPR